MPNNTSSDITNEDQLKDIGISDADKQEKLQINPEPEDKIVHTDEQVVPSVVSYNPSEEQDMDELVHQQNIGGGGNLPDPESIPRNEDDEFNEGRLTKK